MRLKDEYSGYFPNFNSSSGFLSDFLLFVVEVFAKIAEAPLQKIQSQKKAEKVARGQEKQKWRQRVAQ